MNLPQEKLKILTAQVIELSLVCGAFLRQESSQFDYSKVELKGKNDLVSYVDKQSEQMMVSGLQKILPEAGFLTEEGTIETDSNPLRWIIDPLDGTTNFVHGLPVFSTSIALIDGNELLIGVVYEVNKDECFSAFKKGGAFMNGKPISVSNIKTLDESLLATGFPYHDFNKTKEYLNILNHFMQNAHGLRRLGSAAVDLAYVAMGRFEGFFEYNLNAWDVAAGVLIVQEAGGTVSTFSGGDDYVFGKEIIASNQIHAEMKEVIEKWW
jgi:myo-inositol-1(or 4)-monophosphatase